MRSILDAHVTEPGLAVVEIAAADDATAFAIQQLLAERCATARGDRTTRDPGEPKTRRLAPVRSASRINPCGA
ncbi:hypothetical protein B0675_36620 [Streptomyces sp. M41(2017)]|uniref:DUF6207 family protein n=1 Tax=Streptomyces sp. M41(2017) TaxID=1955065 RepID=UPI0009BE80B9|nr:DUF6207 family protein [Streptomyces sp. M41(2017)]OQQ13160.1 hypothetical protein B0675_36620 [Streptomyces sp. M41(2017)]